MQFLDPTGTLVHPSIDGRGHSKRPTNNSTNPRQKPSKRLRPLFPVDDFHGGDVIAEENARNPAPVHFISLQPQT